MTVYILTPSRFLEERGEEREEERTVIFLGSPISFQGNMNWATNLKKRKYQYLPDQRNVSLREQIRIEKEGDN